MVAEFKSHVLSRNEKGFMGIPFKRLLLAGVGGGLVYTFAKIAVSDWAIPLAVGSAITFVLLTSPQGGIPRWQRLLFRVRGSLMLQAARSPESASGKTARLMELPAQLVKLDAAAIFAAPTLLTEANLTEWITFAQIEDVDRNDGLVFVNTPLEVQ